MRIFKIGEKAWLLRVGRQEKHVECPDCLGTKRLRFIPADGEEVLLECRGCQSGFYGAQGTVRTWDCSAIVEEILIQGVETEMDELGGAVACGYKYNMQGSCANIARPEYLFETKDEADLAGILATKRENEAELKRAMCKTKDHKSWAWHVSYHRGEIRDAKKRIEYAEEQLGYALVAAEKAKKKWITST